jgi:hypothetical protein
MFLCSVCAVEVPEGCRSCPMCGTPVETDPAPVEEAAMPTAVAPSELPADGRYCPACARIYGPGENTDGYCTCGTELLSELPVLTPEQNAPPPSAEMDFSLDVPAETKNGRPAPGTPCLVLYGPDKQPLRYFALVKDTTLIGRLDAVSGNFPDVELDEWFDRGTIRKISRQHALVLRSRGTRTFALRPLAGNTGTQLEGDMVAPQQDYPLRPGHRIILGGVVRLKFEIA